MIIYYIKYEYSLFSISYRSILHTIRIMIHDTFALDMTASHTGLVKSNNNVFELY